MRQDNIGQHCSELGRCRGKPGIQDNLHVKTSPVETESDYLRVSEGRQILRANGKETDGSRVGEKKKWGETERSRE